MGASPLLLFITKVAAAVVVRKLRISHVLPLLSNKNSVYKRRKTLLINPAVINSFRVVRIILSKLILFIVEKADNKEKNPCLFCLLFDTVKNTDESCFEKQKAFCIMQIRGA